MRKSLISLAAGLAVIGGALTARAGTDFGFSPITNNTILVPAEVNQYLIQATSSDTNRGVVSGNVNDWMDQDQTATLFAAPNTNNHSRLVNWTAGLGGAELSTNATYSFNVTSPLTNAVANFDVERFNVQIQNGSKYGLNPTNFNNVAYGGSVTSTATSVYSTPVNGTRTRMTGLKR